MKRTKILATLGPATSTPERIQGLHHAGVNAFRINMSHGKPDEWKALIDHVRSIAPGAPIVMDTRGPEVRIINITDEIELDPSHKFTFSIDPHDTQPHLSQKINVSCGQRILFDDGAISTTVDKVEGNLITVTVEAGGTLTNRRKVTVPDNTLDLPVIDERDAANLRYAREHGVDAIALSFTQSAADVETCRTIVGDDIMIIAKVENRTAVEKHVEIIQAADGLMIGRGDLGVEIPLEEVPLVQKTLTAVCNELGVPVIVATQMLESMTHSSSPTRAEVSDVANAILDGADCVMLSGETAIGSFPIETVHIMSRIAEHTDRRIAMLHEPARVGKMSVDEAISNAVYDLSKDIDCQAIITATTSGFTARKVSRLRPTIPIIAVTHSEAVQRHLELSWGVNPCMIEDDKASGEQIILGAVKASLARGFITEDDRIIATAGVKTMEKGATNLIEVHHVHDFLEYHRSKE